jgi:putative ABC transport system permease protein
MITIEHVKKTFNKRHANEVKAIDDTSLKLGDNGLVALLGPSGSGKTTLLNMIGGLDKPNKGKIYINGKRFTHKSAYQRDKIRNLNIGYIFQDYKLIDNLSVYDNVALVLKMQGLKNKEEIKKRVNYVLETLGIYRFRNRPAEMLSGGERQRVGIARAIVKDPEIIIADEPTGNLDSRNSLEIMNIIKCISKTRLVILVTHEVTLANFFASRIIEIADGKVVKDYENKNSEELDYRLENNIYLKDIKNVDKYNKDKDSINIYKEDKEPLNLTLVVRDGNIFIKSNDNNNIEVVDDNSNIELIDDHYKKLNQEEASKYEFNFSKVIDNNYKKKYSSIYNPITLLINGFKRVGNYSVMKKILLLGFLIASMFIVFGISRIFGALQFSDSDFITENKTYVSVKKSKFTMEDLNAIKSLANVNYVIPGNSSINMTITFNTLIQNYNNSLTVTSSLSSSSLLTTKDLIYGRLPQNDYEVVVDKMSLKSLHSFDDTATQYGMIKYSDFIGMKLTNQNMDNFTIVGITNKNSPSLYANPNILINMLANQFDPNDSTTITYIDYTLKPNYTIKKGRLPENDYEVAINYNEYGTYWLNSKLDNKINGQKLKVVGFYQTTDDTNLMLVNNNMILYTLLKKEVSVSSNNKDKTIEALTSNGFNATDVYKTSKEKYQQSKEKGTKSVMIVSAVMIGISLIEIFLMIRSSFLSKIKEIGTYRAIGVKKSDIKKMFLGEILAISLTASTLGIGLMSYIIYNLHKMPQIGNLFVINSKVILLSFATCFIFNILVGLIPVKFVIRKTPAAILARHDI